MDKDMQQKIDNQFYKLAVQIFDQDVTIPRENNSSYSIIDGHILFINIDYDDCAENPFIDWDGIGKIYTRLRNDPSCAPEKFDKAVQDNEDAILLGYFEHGACAWHIDQQLPAGTEGDYKWDGCHKAGVWVPDECLLDEVYSDKDERKKRMEEFAREACDMYTKWLNGEVYRYDLSVHRCRYEGEQLYDDIDDYRFIAPLHEDSCGEMYGIEELEANIKDNVVPVIAEILKGQMKCQQQDDIIEFLDKQLKLKTGEILTDLKNGEILTD